MVLVSELYVLVNVTKQDHFFNFLTVASSVRYHMLSRTLGEVTHWSFIVCSEAIYFLVSQTNCGKLSILLVTVLSEIGTFLYSTPTHTLQKCIQSDKPSRSRN